MHTGNYIQRLHYLYLCKKGAKLYNQKNPKLSLMNFKYIKIIYSRPPSASRTLRDISPMKVLPEAMTKQCLVRCKVRKYYDVNYLLSYDLFIIAFRMKILLFCMRDSISFRQVRINTIISVNVPIAQWFRVHCTGAEGCLEN